MQRSLTNAEPCVRLSPASSSWNSPLAYKRHILTSKGTKRKRQLDKDVMLDKADVPKIKRMIPY
ncbi:MAG: bL35 family ribosomal protein [Candidatus Korobacteraceae bacterium]